MAQKSGKNSNSDSPQKKGPVKWTGPFSRQTAKPKTFKYVLPNCEVYDYNLGGEASSAL